MEMACDERVMKLLGPEERKPYSLALLKAAERGSGLVLAFGESSTRLRIKNILNYRKPRFWVSLLLTVLLICAGLGLATNSVVPDVRMVFVVFYERADGPFRTFLAGKSGGGEEPGGNAGTILHDQMPNEEWLTNTTFTATLPGEKNSGRISLDMATENSVVFHGEFGLFAFNREGGQWKLNYFIPGAEAAKLGTGMGDTTGIWSKDTIHMEDRLRLMRTTDDFTGAKLNEGWQDFDAKKMSNGEIAVLGGYSKDGTARLIDLFYGYYDPKVQVFHQVYLFIGDGAMIENPKGEISRMRYQSGGIYAVEMQPGELSEDAKTIERITEHLLTAYFKGDSETIRAYAVENGSEDIELYHTAGQDEEVPKHRIHGLYAIKDALIDDIRMVWCVFGGMDSSGSADEPAFELMITFVKTADGWKMKSMNHGDIS